MTLYLRIAVGEGCYLLDAKHVLEVRPASAGDARAADNATKKVDLREMFAEPVAAQGSHVLVAQAEGPPAGLIVDRVDGLAEFEEAAFYPLPTIGPLGTLIDGVATQLGGERPMLRLRGERAVAVAAAFE